MIVKYADKLRLYLDINPIEYAEGESLLEELYWCYIETNPFDNPELRERFQALHHSFPELSEDRFDDLFAMLNDVSILQEKLAFQIGAKIGLRLAAELFE